MSVIIQYDLPHADEYRNAIEPLLEKWKGLLPSWVETVKVGLRQGEEGDTLSTIIHPEYRNGWVLVHPGFLLWGEAAREQGVIHEFLHFSLEPLCDVLRDLRQACVDKDSPLDMWALEQQRKATECVVTDLEHGIARVT